MPEPRRAFDDLARAFEDLGRAVTAASERAARGRAPRPLAPFSMRDWHRCAGCGGEVTAHLAGCRRAPRVRPEWE